MIPRQTTIKNKLSPKYFSFLVTGNSTPSIDTEGYENPTERLETLRFLKFIFILLCSEENFCVLYLINVFG